MYQLQCGLGMEEHLVNNFLSIKLMEINKLEDLNNLRTAPQLSDIQEKKLLEELEENILNTLNINFLAIWHLCRLSWDHLCTSGRGRIIVLVSMSGKRSKGDLAAYSSSKFALMGLCQTMKNKGWDKNIRISAICPSWVNTKMAQNISSLDKSAPSLDARTYARRLLLN